jgi:hypothetical protein
MDAAKACGVAVSGWCPAGGWAEDYPTPPGVLELYPQMLETPSSNVAQRTEWNIRDSSCCLVLNTHSRGISKGTDIGYALYAQYDTPYYEITIDGEESLDAQIDAAYEWIESLNDDAIVLGIGGPRKSECPKAYDIAYRVIESLLKRLA